MNDVQELYDAEDEYEEDDFEDDAEIQPLDPTTESVIEYGLEHVRMHVGLLPSSVKTWSDAFKHYAQQLGTTANRVGGMSITAGGGALINNEPVQPGLIVRGTFGHADKN